MEQPSTSGGSKCGVAKIVPPCGSGCSNNLRPNCSSLAACAEKQYFHPCCDGPCTSEQLTMVGQAAVLNDGPMTSSGLAHKYTKPIERINEDVSHDCLLVADTTLELAPLHLRQLFANYEKSKLSQAHILFLLVYLVALESGYITQTQYEKLCNLLLPLLSSSTFHVRNVLLICRSNPPYEKDAGEACFYTNLRLVLNRPLDGKDKRVNSLLTALISGEYMIVTLTPDASTQLSGRSTCLSISRFVITKFVANREVQHHFRKLDQLSMQLRNDVFVPVRNSQLELMQKFPFPGLVGLPRELLSQIFKHLNENNINKLAHVNTVFRDEIKRRAEASKSAEASSNAQEN